MMNTRAMALIGILVSAAVAGPPALPNLQPAEPASGVGTLNDYLRSSDQDVQIRDGLLSVDALRSREPVYALRRDKAFQNVTATVQFRIDPVGMKREFGLVFGSTNATTHHAVHVDRTSVILYEYRPGQPPRELARRAGFTKPDGQWYEAKVETSGPQVKVFFDGKFLFAFNSPQLQAGHVGVYANGGRAWVRKLDIGGTPTPARLPQAWRGR
ncbi:MAG TPA: family 16 glycoside hydrolase [Planctomycetota bacterium]|nr:family 16 glycoside hydrolase [Planctomycetota bacterium]